MYSLAACPFILDLDNMAHSAMDSMASPFFLNPTYVHRAEHFDIVF